ncbi:CHAT domain-containing tetratricopeptide repeat protein [Sorangium sp. So ce542]|uniref:CHAT domain-containing tetratricopeptide repeat protein n=1 Tax=Sorangium sp. So ce542 TaxID=3133316 RepID=UPI003F60C12C
MTTVASDLQGATWRTAEVDEANRLTAEADARKAQGRYEGAIPLLKRALALYENVLGTNHPTVAKALSNLGVLHREQGDYAQAEQLHRRALAMRAEALGPDHPVVASSLNDLSVLYRTRGNYARAESLAERALAIRENALGPDHPDVAQSLATLAVLCGDKGDYARSESLHLRALAIREEALGKGHPDVALSLNDLAALYRAKRDYAQAELLSERALAIQEKALPPDHPAVALALNNVAVLYGKRGDYARAEPMHQRALAIQRKVLAPDHPDVARTFHFLASLYLDKGDYARAEGLSERALAIRQKALGPSHPDVAQSLSHLAALHIAQSRIDEAVKTAGLATDIQDRNAAAVLATGSEDQKRSYMSTLVDQTHLDIALHIQHAPATLDAARLALTVLFRRKGRVLDAMTGNFASLRLSRDPGDRDLIARLTSVYSQLAAEVSRGPQNAPPAQYRERLAALEQQREALEAEVGKRSASFRAEQKPVILPDVQAAIPEGAALVEIAQYRPYHLRPDTRSGHWGAPRYVAYVLGPGGDPAFTDLGEAAPLEAAVDALRRALADHDLTHDPRPAARDLDRLLMEPVRELLGDTRWVFLSLDGPLHLVPFGALVDEEGQYLVERYLFSYLTTGRDLLRFEDREAASREPPLILANPAFDESSAPPAPEATHRGVRSIDMVTQRLLPLQGTTAEARTIAEFFPESRVLLGAHATEEAVKAVQGPLLLHLATHGFFLPEQPVPAALLTTPGHNPTLAELAALRQRENPLLRSGIALAGFNRRRSGSDDGVLTALETAGIDLHGTRLVVLSTCESGLGEASSGEGVYGLRRALTMAGSETQVMSLWQVDSGRTRELMQAYYQRLAGGAGRSQAMRDVQLAMRAEPSTAHPNLWASFIVSGDWRRMETQVRSPEAGKVAKGARGCACEQTGGEPHAHGAWVAALLGLLVAARRRRSLRA